MSENYSATRKSENVDTSTTASQEDSSLAPEQPEKLVGSSEVAAVSNNEPTADEYPHGLRLITLVLAINLAMFLASLDQTILGTAIPKITDEFHGLSQVSWYGSAYFMCLGGFQSTWGKVYKYFPLKISFAIAVFVFELGSLICGVARNSNTFIVGRAIAGIGGAGITSGSTVILAFSAEPAKRPTLMSTMGVTYCIAFILGPLIGGAFSEKVTWRWCFYINLPIGGLAMALFFLFFRTPSVSTTQDATLKEKLLHMDPVGTVLAMGGIISFILALQYAGVSHAWNSSVVIGLLVGFVLIMFTLAAWEYFQGDYAMLPYRLFKRRVMWAGGIFQFFFVGCYFLLLFYLPIYFQSIKGVSAIHSGVDNLPLVLSACLFIIMGGAAVEKTHMATPYMTAGAAVAAVATGLLYTLDVDTSSGKWIGYQVLVGAGLAFPFQNALNILQAEVDADDMSPATSSLYFFQILGGAFSISAAQAAFNNRLLHSLTTNAPGVSPLLVLATGASDLRSVFSADELPGVILSYMDGLKAAFAVSVGLVGTAFLVSFIVPWKKINLKPGEAVAMA
ncbi:MFS domain-containing protein [Trichoderma simmonsii]|uniref:MFS domain-containing protein n=1 Tax=Trichoderma simmonsii TaxID=1491479 RepID=A0A8G0PGK6_9HYPO|nr:MFS domain-containing protein [Trichoderma simmonsii]